MIIHFKERRKILLSTNFRRRKKKIQRRVIKIGEKVTGIEITKIEVTKGQPLLETTEISIKMIGDFESVTRKKIIGTNLVEILIKMRNLKIGMTDIKIEIGVKIMKR